MFARSFLAEMEKIYEKEAQGMSGLERHFVEQEKKWKKKSCAEGIRGDEEEKWNT